jgi:lipid-binding SYLF domain-containing protein
MAVLLCLLVAASIVTPARDHDGPAKESSEAAKVLGQIMDAPDKAIPKSILNDAECVAVFPSTIKGGFIVGARKGDGVVSCRTSNGWSAPVFLDMSGGSVGAQIGVQSTDYVFLFMNENGVNHLLSSKFSIGGEVSAAAGPVGREASASTDWKLNSQILTYSRSKGLFAGATLEGVTISTDGSDLKEIYGGNYDVRKILRTTEVAAPPAVRTFSDALSRYSAHNMSKK